MTRHQDRSWGIAACTIGAALAAASPSIAIDISVPDATTVYQVGDVVQVAWSSAPSGGTVVADLYRDGDFVTVYHPETDNDGVANRCCVEASWGSGSDFRVRLEHVQTGEVGWSEPFSIGVSEPSITVTYPAADTVLAPGDDIAVFWEDAPAGGQVIALLHDGDVEIDVWHTWTPNDGDAFTCCVDPAWGSGRDFRVRVEHEDGAFGWSAPFTIEPHGGSIDVTVPNAETVYGAGDVVQVAWSGAPSGGTVVADLYRGGEFVAVYHPETDNDGVANRCCVEPSWGSGSDFRVRLEHLPTGEFGWSDPFTIDQDSGTIDVTFPTAGFTYTVGDDVDLQWSGAPAGGTIIGTLYRGDELVDVYHPETANDGSASRCCSPEYWGAGDDFRVRVEHVQTGEFGWSAPFTFLAPGQTIDVTVPESGGWFAHGEVGIVAWSGAPAGGTITADVFFGPSPLGVWHVETGNDGMATFCCVDSAWGTGHDYRVRVQHSDGVNYGWSGAFTLRCAAGDVDVDGSVAFDDLLTVLTAWGAADPILDVDRSGVVDFGDVVLLLSEWGDCG